MKPVRLQRSRKKGSRLTSPNGLPVVFVGRPSRYGNPHKIGWCSICGVEHTQYGAVMEFAAMVCYDDVREKIKRDLRGKNLACWCRLDQPCHADTLLAIASED